MDNFSIEIKRNENDVLDKFELLTLNYKKMLNGQNNDELTNISDNKNDIKDNITNNMKNINQYFKSRMEKIKDYNEKNSKLNKMREYLESYLENLKNKKNIYNNINKYYIENDKELTNNNLKNMTGMKENINKIFCNQKYIEEEICILSMISEIDVRILECNSDIGSFKLEFSELKKMINDNLDKDIDETLKKDMLCTICYTNKIEMCITPCGHTFCCKCTKNIKNKCFICNTHVTTTTKLYILGSDNTNDIGNITENILPANHFMGISGGTSNLFPSLTFESISGGNIGVYDGNLASY